MKNNLFSYFKNKKLKSNNSTSEFINKKSFLSIKKFSLSNLQMILLSVSIILIVLGIIFGDCVTIFRKAVFICMECIGIG